MYNHYQHRFKRITGGVFASFALAAPAAHAESVPAEVAIPAAGAYKVCVGSGNDVLNTVVNLRCTDAPVVQSGTLRLNVEYQRSGTPASELVFVDNAPAECGEERGVAIRSNPNQHNTEGEIGASASLTGVGTDGASVHRETGAIRVLSGTYRFAYACNLPADVPAASAPEYSAPSGPKGPGDTPEEEPEREADAQPQAHEPQQPAPQPAASSDAQPQSQGGVLGAQARALDLKVLFRRQRLHTVMTRGYQLQVVCTVDCAIAAEIRGQSARTSRLVLLGRASTNGVGGDRASITVRLTRAAKAALALRRRATVNVVVRVRDVTGQQRTLTQKVLLTR